MDINEGYEELLIRKISVYMEGSQLSLGSSQSVLAVSPLKSF